MPLSTTHTKWIFLIIFILMVITGLYISAPYLNLHALHNHYLQINQWKDQHLLLSIVLVSLIYIIVTSLGIPGALWLTIITGFLYGIGLGLSIVLISATIGATILYIIARWLGAQWLQQNLTPH